MPLASNCSKRGTCEASSGESRPVLSASNCSKRGTCEAEADVVLAAR